MKKISSLIAILTINLFAFSANAKTEGSYVGLDLIKNSVQVKSNSNLASDQANFSQFYNHKKDDTAYGGGINYKYAFNFNNFFIAPEVAFNFLNNEIKAGYAGTQNNPYSQSLKLKSQASFQTNFGYDITDRFSAYIPLGISIFNYELNTKDVGSLGSYVTTKKTGRESALFFGAGLAYEPIKNWIVNLEYNKFKEFKITSSTATISGGQIVAKTNVDAVKLGVSYRF